MLLGRRAANISAEFVALKFIIMNVQKYEIVQIGPPPGACLTNIRSAIHVDAEFPHRLGAQLSRVRRRVNEKNAFLLDGAIDGRGERQSRQDCSHAGTDLGLAEPPRADAAV